MNTLYQPTSRSGEQIFREQTSDTDRPEPASSKLHPLEITTLRMLICFKEKSIVNKLADQDITNLILLLRLIMGYGSNIWNDRRKLFTDLHTIATQNEVQLANSIEFKAKADWQRQCCRILINIVFTMSQAGIFSWQNRTQLEIDLSKITSEMSKTHLRKALVQATNPGYQI